MTKIVDIGIGAAKSRPPHQFGSETPEAPPHPVGRRGDQLVWKERRLNFPIRSDLNDVR